MANEDAGLADELEEAMHVTFPPLKPPSNGDYDTDTGRTTRLMGEQMQKVLVNLEADLKEAREAKTLLDERITDIQSAVAAVKASLEVLGRIDRRPKGE